MSNLLFFFAKFQGFISIDCGSDEDYIDEETGIPYKSDKDLIDTGIDTWWIISEYNSYTTQDYHIYCYMLSNLYPNDVYDRIWGPLLFDNWIPIATNSTVYSSSNDNPYNLPDLVLKTAVKTHNASTPLSLYWSSPDSLSKYYVYFHFVEIEKLRAGQQRELTINLNDERNLIESVKLDYLNPRTIVQNYPPISGKQISFSIQAAKGTKRPPFLNALEFFQSIELPNKTSSIDDVEAIMDIKKMYNVTRNWQGDPCVPSEYLWDGLNCNDNHHPRIISLNLSSSNMTGEIAISFFNLKAMQSLDLSYNDLTGPLPEFLALLPNLNTFNVNGNKLTGSVLEALLQKFRDGKLILSVGENPDLCMSVPCKRKKKKEYVIPIIVSSIAAVLVLLFIFSALAICRRKRQGVDMVTKSNIKSKNQHYSYSEVVSITNNFKTIIGEGGFGKVYLGKLRNETQVAVKLLSTSSNQGYKEFRAEAQLVMIVHHRNLVSLVGYCDEGEKKALIYEYMANGNLHRHLSVTNRNVLTWNERLHIAVDAEHELKECLALEMAHERTQRMAIEGNLTTSNIPFKMTHLEYESNIVPHSR
uniref:non-specific serine/threonine protein kinase n=1 Tax=Quercus lobata TaxID=97700 RepID=A0A7N2KXY8_QUELO